MAATAAILATLAFLPSLSGAFLYDDSRSIVENRAIRDLGQLGTILRFEPSRPLLSLTWALNYAVSGLRPWSYHLVNIAVHAANAALVASLFLWLGRRSGRPHAEAAALLGACLFAITPMAVETVAYVSSRSTALASLFTLAALRVALAGLEGRTRLVPIALGIYAAGLLVKEEAASLPALLLLVDYFFISGMRLRDVAGRLRLHAPFVLLPLTGLVARRAVTGAWLPPPAVAPGLYLWTQLTQLPGYLLRALVPLDPAFYRAVRVSSWPPGPAATLLGVAAGVVLGLALFGRRRWPGPAFAILWFVAALAPSSSIVALKEMVVDHRAYLAGVGVLYVVSGWLWAPGRLVFAAALLAVLGTRSVQYQNVLGDPVRAWEDALERAPLSVEASQGLAEAYRAAGDPRSTEVLVRATHLAPHDPRVWANLGAALLESGQPEHAVEALRRATLLAPGNARLHDNLGAVLESLGRTEDAVAAYEAARAGSPPLAQPRIRLAEIALGRGNPQRARALIDEAVGLEIDEQEVRAIQELQRRLP
jgi:protein O-mannosyl-transferase